LAQAPSWDAAVDKRGFVARLGDRLDQVID
jgi:hypothetical protein